MRRWLRPQSFSRSAHRSGGGRLPAAMAEATARVLALWGQGKDRYDVPVVHALSQLRSGRST